MSPLETQKNVLPFLRECSLLAPTFLSLDNHEWMLDSTDLITLASTCVVVLDNTYQSITFDEKEIILGGLTSGYVTDYRRFKKKRTALIVIHVRRASAESAELFMPGIISQRQRGSPPSQL